MQWQWLGLGDFLLSTIVISVVRCELDFAGNTDLIHRETLVFLIYFFRAKSKTLATVDLVANFNDLGHVACLSKQNAKLTWLHS